MSKYCRQDAIYFQIINFDEYKNVLGLNLNEEEALIEEIWAEQLNGVFVKSLMSEDYVGGITYMGLRFSKSTDSHNYSEQEDIIKFITDGSITFSTCEDRIPYIHKFEAGDAILIPPQIIRKLIPPYDGVNLEIELILGSPYDANDEKHVSD